MDSDVMSIDVFDQLLETQLEQPCAGCSELFIPQKLNKEFCSYNCYRQNWRKNNPDKVKAQQQKHYYGNREKEINRTKKYNKTNREKISITAKKYRDENYEKIIEKTNLWKRRNKDKVKLYDMRKHVKRNYQITLDEYLELAKKQDGKCAICGESKNLVLDHCHKTKKIREFLCRNCNVGLGNFRESEDLMLIAIKYILKHQNKE